MLAVQPTLNRSVVRVRNWRPEIFRMRDLPERTSVTSVPPWLVLSMLSDPSATSKFTRTHKKTCVSCFRSEFPHHKRSSELEGWRSFYRRRCD